MSNTNGEIPLANTISGVAVDLDLALVETLDSGPVEWITIGKDLCTKNISLF
jgi:hypothetical protein